MLTEFMEILIEVLRNTDGCLPRYAPATQLWRGRLHVMGGSKEDRHEPALDHWSLAVKDGKALENEWRNEIPIPRGGPHRFVCSCLVEFIC